MLAHKLCSLGQSKHHAMADAFRHDIFISYKKADSDFVKELVTALESEGFRVWTDDRLSSGELWFEKIKTELAASRAIIGVWSKFSVDADGRFIPSEEDKFPYVEYEHRLAGDRLVGVLLDAPERPGQFARVQASDLNGWKLGDTNHKGWQQMLDQLRGLCTPSFLVAQIRHLESNAERHRTKADEFRRRATVLQEQLRTEQQLVAKLEADAALRLESDADDLSAARAEASKIRTELTILKASVAAQQLNEIQQAEQNNHSIKELSDELSRMRQELEYAKRENESTARALNDSRISNALLQERLTDAEATIGRKQAELDIALSCASENPQQSQAQLDLSSKLLADIEKHKSIEFDLQANLAERNKSVEILSARVKSHEDGSIVKNLKRDLSLTTAALLVMCVSATLYPLWVAFGDTKEKQAPAERPGADQPMSNQKKSTASLAQLAKKIGLPGRWGLGSDCTAPYTLTVSEPDRLTFSASGEVYSDVISSVRELDSIATDKRRGPSAQTVSTASNGDIFNLNYEINRIDNLVITSLDSGISFGEYTRCGEATAPGNRP